MSTEGQHWENITLSTQIHKKMNDILEVIVGVDWSISKFLCGLFRLENRDDQHQQMVVNRMSKWWFEEILQFTYENAQLISYRKGNEAKLVTEKFAPDLWPESLHHAKPAMIYGLCAWWQILFATRER